MRPSHAPATPLGGLRLTPSLRRGRLQSKFSVADGSGLNNSIAAARVYSAPSVPGETMNEPLLSPRGLWLFAGFSLAVCLWWFSNQPLDADSPISPGAVCAANAPAVRKYQNTLTPIAVPRPLLADYPEF